MREQDVASLDGDFNHFIDSISAESLGLTIEEYRYYRTLSDEAMEVYMQEHSRIGEEREKTQADE